MSRAQLDGLPTDHTCCAALDYFINDDSDNKSRCLSIVRRVAPLVLAIFAIVVSFITLRQPFSPVIAGGCAMGFAVVHIAIQFLKRDSKKCSPDVVIAMVTALAIFALGVGGVLNQIPGEVVLAGVIAISLAKMLLNCCHCIIYETTGMTVSTAVKV